MPAASHTNWQYAVHKFGSAETLFFQPMNMLILYVYQTDIHRTTALDQQIT